VTRNIQKAIASIVLGRSLVRAAYRRCLLSTSVRRIANSLWMQVPEAVQNSGSTTLASCLRPSGMVWTKISLLRSTAKTSSAASGNKRAGRPSCARTSLRSTLDRMTVLHAELQWVRKSSNPHGERLLAGPLRQLDARLQDLLAWWRVGASRHHSSSSRAVRPATQLSSHR
jgi:hypothetical protein